LILSDREFILINKFKMTKNKEIFVRKATGGRDKFRPEKIKNTCLRIGVNPETAQKIVDKVSEEIYNGISTKKILEKTRYYLKEISPVLSDIYSLKSAMLELGPDGFIFEEYCRRLLNYYNIPAVCPKTIFGFCISHEVDIIFENEKKYTFIECKYHNRQGIYCGSKDILYTWARFLDLQDGFKSQKNFYNFTSVWLITNTKFSDHAKQFGLCKKMGLLGWNWPENGGLAYYIKKAKFWPITILSNIDNNIRKILFKEGIILISDLLKPNFTLKNGKISQKKISIIQEEAQKVMDYFEE